MIQKIVHFQYISFFYNTVFSNSLFQKFHFFASFVPVSYTHLDVYKRQYIFFIISILGILSIHKI